MSNETEIKELGQEGLVEFNKTVQFGAIIENGWASNDNPHRFGIFISRTHNRIQLTNGKGDFWETAHDERSRSKIVGTINNGTFENINHH